MFSYRICGVDSSHCTQAVSKVRKGKEQEIKATQLHTSELFAWLNETSRIKTSLPSPRRLHRLTHREKAGAESTTFLSYIAHRKQSLIPRFTESLVSKYGNGTHLAYSQRCRNSLEQHRRRAGREDCPPTESRGRIQLCTMKIELPLLDLGKPGDFK